MVDDEGERRRASRQGVAPVVCQQAGRRLWYVTASFLSLNVVKLNYSFNNSIKLVKYSVILYTHFQYRIMISSNSKFILRAVTSYANDFTFLTVKGSGHMVPQFRPVQAFAMFERMIKNLPFDNDPTDAKVEL